MTSPLKRTPQQWAEWYEGFKKRNGLDKPLPAPPVDAPEPPKHHSDDDRNEETDR